jgi:hypothetical protein
MIFLRPLAFDKKSSCSYFVKVSNNFFIFECDNGFSANAKTWQGLRLMNVSPTEYTQSDNCRFLADTLPVIHLYPNMYFVVTPLLPASTSCALVRQMLGLIDTYFYALMMPPQQCCHLPERFSAKVFALKKNRKRFSNNPHEIILSVIEQSWQCCLPSVKLSRNI